MEASVKAAEKKTEPQSDKSAEAPQATDGKERASMWQRAHDALKKISPNEKEEEETSPFIKKMGPANPDRVRRYKGGAEPPQPEEGSRRYEKLKKDEKENTSPVRRLVL